MKIYIDGSFYTGTGAEVIPVIKIDGRMIGDRTPGFVTERLISGFKKMVSLY